MTSKWTKRCIGELCEVKHGWAFKGEYFSDEGDLLLLTPGNFLEEGGIRLRENKEKFYVGDFPNEYLLYKNDLLVVMTDLVQSAPILGGSAWVPSNNRYLHNQRLGKIVNIKDDLVCKEFLYWIFNFDGYRSQVKGSASGATVRHTAPERIYKCKVHLPSIQMQQKIATILSAYGDLIEINLKRIKLLEEMAQITYDEWFVRLKFPGYETTPMDSETGLPLVWEKTTCFDLMDVLSGGTPKTDVAEYWDGNIKFFTPKDAANCVYTLQTEKTITELGLKKCNSKLYPKNTIFITARGTVGKLNLAREAMAMNQSCYALIAKNGLSQLFLFCALNNAIGAFKGAANGGVFDAIVVDTFRYISIIKPDEELIEQFDSIIKPIFEQVDNLIKQNRLLKEARDILLPRLMTGMIDVEQLVLPDLFSNTPSIPAQEPQAA
jgi:type I restriction enzyme, S subunit